MPTGSGASTGGRSGSTRPMRRPPAAPCGSTRRGRTPSHSWTSCDQSRRTAQRIASCRRLGFGREFSSFAFVGGSQRTRLESAFGEEPRQGGGGGGGGGG